MARATLGASPAGLLTDLDGTLAPIVASPEEARPVEGAVDALERLASRLAVVGVVTGRAAGDARRMLGNPRSLLVVGNHGLEWLEPGADVATVDPSLAPLRTMLAGLLARVPSGDGVTVEDKGLSATVHYRRAADPPGARDRILGALGAVPSEALEIREGRMSVEIRLAGVGDKGTALRQVVERNGLRGLVVAGDDLTDLDMFTAAHDLGAAGGVRVSVLAIAGGREVPHGVIAAADLTLGAPADFARLLTHLARALAAPGRIRSNAEPGR